jgi:hypothetical protein
VCSLWSCQAEDDWGPRQGGLGEGQKTVEKMLKELKGFIDYEQE